MIALLLALMDTAPDPTGLEKQHVSRERELESALQEIVRVATQPISSMRPIKQQLRQRGQEMLDIAWSALRD